MASLIHPSTQQSSAKQVRAYYSSKLSSKLDVWSKLKWWHGIEKEYIPKEEYKPRQKGYKQEMNIKVQIEKECKSPNKKGIKKSKKNMKGKKAISKTTMSNLRTTRNYCKVASSNNSCLEAVHAGLF